MLTSPKVFPSGERNHSLLVLQEQTATMASLLGDEFPRPLLASANADHLLEMLERGAATEILLELRPEEPTVLDLLGLLHSLRLPVDVYLLTSSVPRWEGWRMPPWLHLYELAGSGPTIREVLVEQRLRRPAPSTPLKVGDVLTLIEAGSLSLRTRLCLETRGELELVSHEGEVRSALLGDTLGSEALIDTLYEPVSSARSRRHTGPLGYRWVFDSLQAIFQSGSLKNPGSGSATGAESRTDNVVPITRTSKSNPGRAESERESATPTESEESDAPQGRRRKGDINTRVIDNALEQAMLIAGARAAAVADVDSGQCLGFRSIEEDFPAEIVCAGDAELVRAQLKLTRQQSPAEEIEDIQIILGKKFHLIVPIAGERILLYIALYRATANLALARLQAHAAASLLETQALDSSPPD